MIGRRSFLTGLVGTAICSPAIVRIGSLMRLPAPVRAGYYELTEVGIRCLEASDSWVAIGNYRFKITGEYSIDGFHEFETHDGFRTTYLPPLA